MKGRLENSALNYEAKFPILLRDHHFTHLVIRKYHIDSWHGGVEATLSLFRSRFWVVRGRQIVKRVIYRCVKCKRHQSKGILPPTSPPLPQYRVATEYCFQTTGTDFAGPLLVKAIYGNSSNLYKAYICIFTCATSRAIHLEITPDLEAETFIRAFRRFVARRGSPKLLISDNAQTFKSKLLRSFLLKIGTEHTFILPASPWWGDFTSVS